MRPGPTLREAERKAGQKRLDVASGFGTELMGPRGSSNAFIARSFVIPYALPAKPDQSPETLQNVDGSIASGIVGWNA
jgi:hypothetical protein